MLATVGVKAQTNITFDGTSTTWTTEQTEQSETKDGVTIATTQGVYNTQYRIYKNQTFTVSSTAGNITKVEFTCTASGDAKYGPGCFTDATAGSYTYEGTMGTWTGDAAEFSMTASLNQVRATQIVVTIKSNGEQKPAKPTISGTTEFTDSTEVTITAAEGCKIYYSYDEGDFADLSDCTEYTAPFTLTATSTIYAQAVDAEGKKSDIASKTFTKLNLPEVNNIADIALYDDGTKILLTFTMTAVCQNGNNLVVRDGYNSILVYGNTGQTYKNGENVPMGAIAEVSSYGGNKQLKPVKFGAALPGAPIEPTTVTATTLAEQGYLAYVKMENVSLSINNKNLTITDEDGVEVAGYNQFGLNLTALDTEAKFDIIGVYGSYNGNKQLQPTEIKSLAPAYVPEGDGTLANPYTVKDIKHLCATADAPEGKVWVKGTIAGNVNTTTGELVVPADAETAANTNMMLQTGNDMISVQLPNNAVRTALNIKDNFSNIGKEVWVYGTIKEIYCKIAAVKNVTDYSWDGITTDIRSINTKATREGKLLQNGKVVIVKNGKTYTTAGAEL